VQCRSSAAPATPPSSAKPDLVVTMLSGLPSRANREHRSSRFKYIAYGLVTCDRLIIHHSQELRRQDVGSMRPSTFNWRNGSAFSRRHRVQSPGRTTAGGISQSLQATLRPSCQASRKIRRSFRDDQTVALRAGSPPVRPASNASIIRSRFGSASMPCNCTRSRLVPGGLVNERLIDQKSLRSVTLTTRPTGSRKPGCNR
jgi:hypothetical protein